MLFHAHSLYSKKNKITPNITALLPAYTVSSGRKIRNYTKGRVNTQLTIMNNEVHSALSGTQTEGSLHTAFDSEAASHAKYKLFADAAMRNGNESLARILTDLAGNEYEHAELILEYLDGIGSDTENLEALIADEDYSSNIAYPELAKIADEEGFSEIAEKMRAISSAEKRHSNILSELYDSMTNNTYEPAVSTLYCPICGYTHDSPTAPDRCPLCSRPGINFRPYK